MADEGDDDRRVARRSNGECRDIANRTKSYYRVERLWPVNIGRILRSGKVPTLRGEKALAYELVDDAALGLKEANTEQIDRDTIRIIAKKTIDFLASCGDGRARMTLAHELGHAVMHAEQGAVDHRPAGAAGTTTLSKLNASESAEHQAKVFASAFLIHDKHAANLESPLEIATEFVVSLSAAEICFERLQEESERAAAAQRVMRSNQEFQELMRQLARPNRHLNVPCPSCKRSTLVLMGTRVFCETCRYKGDHPQSGDPAA